MLSRLLTASRIRLDADCDGWQEAIRRSGEPLLAEGDITGDYIEAVIDAVTELGPYIVLTKNLALPHAADRSGVLSTALSFVRLKNPVFFGNPDNDPVRYCFMLASKDANDHMDALMDFVTLLGDKHFQELMEHSTDPEEIYRYIEENECNR